jgi:retron-type reverse transcriptase
MAAEPATPSDWRRRIREVGRAAFIREEMIRLGFWREDDGLLVADAERLGALRAELAARRAELAPIVRELAELDQRIVELTDVGALLTEIRRRRIERVRVERQQRAERREQERMERREADAVWRRQTLPHLGRAVSAGLRYEGGDPEKVAALGLPALATASDIARAIGIEEPRLAWLAYDRRAATIDHYDRFVIPKRSGGERVISSPKPLLRSAQRWINEAILAPIPVADAAMAFRPGRSVVDNARVHAGRGVVVRVDLQDFFPSITFRRGKGVFASFGYNEGVATILALLVTEYPRVAVTLDGVLRFVAIGERRLPQGACTSPALSNIVVRSLDRRLAGLAASLGFAYSRYADDLVFSHAATDAPVGDLLRAVERIVADEGFAINSAKTLVQRAPHRQTVTGILVNDAPRVSRDDLRRFRALLHRCETRGFDAVSAELGVDALQHARGYLAFVRMVNVEQAASIARRHRWLDAKPTASIAAKAPGEPAPGH